LLPLILTQFDDLGQLGGSVWFKGRAYVVVAETSPVVG
jgi:hypothetical protein